MHTARTTEDTDSDTHAHTDTLNETYTYTDALTSGKYTHTYCGVLVVWFTQLHRSTRL